MVQKAWRDRFEIEFGVEPQEMEARLFRDNDSPTLEILPIQRVDVVSGARCKEPQAR